MKHITLKTMLKYPAITYLALKEHPKINLQLTHILSGYALVALGKDYNKRLEKE